MHNMYYTQYLKTFSNKKNLSEKNLFSYFNKYKLFQLKTIIIFLKNWK